MKKILYHGTSTKYLDKILKKGLTPRKSLGVKSNWDAESRDDMIYLTSAYAPYFAQACVGSNGGDPLVLEVEVESNNLYPDEDFLEQYLRNKNITKGDIHERTKFYKDNLEVFKHYTKKSLNGLGNACHKGIIYPKRIRRYVVLDARKIIMYSDPTITRANYTILGHHYNEICSEYIWNTKEVQLNN